ncbi:FCD domain-containing protein [Methylobacterium sp. D48H]
MPAGMAQHELTTNALRHGALAEPMIDMPVVIRSFYLYTPAKHLQSLHHHEDIVIAARLQDAELGRRAMQLHLKMSQAHV